jgi:6-phosphogluconolactonase
MNATLAVPGLRGQQVLGQTAAESARQLARILTAHLAERLKARPQVHLALSGGSSSRLLAAALASEPGLSSSEWSRVQVWMVDERCVADDDPRLNAKSIRELLLPKVPLPAGNLHPMPVLLPDGASRYECELREAFAARPDTHDARLDATVLGMGPDGHTASLFPETPALDERERWIVLNDGERVAPPRPRMTMTYPLLNRAALIALLVTGAEKREALAGLAADPDGFRSRPVAGVIPSPDSILIWFLDRATISSAPPFPAGDDKSATSLSG